MDEKLVSFKNSHTHMLNIIIHIICGCLYIALISCCFNEFKHNAVLIYSLFVLLLTQNIIIAIIVYILLIIVTNKIMNYKLSILTLLSFAFLFYLLPEIGHILCNESTVLSKNDINPKEIIINILVLLPYSIDTLLSYNFNDIL